MIVVMLPMTKKTSSTLAEVYYSPKDCWRGLAAISKLAKDAGVSESRNEEWLHGDSLRHANARTAGG